jgi:D-alanine-D-alanine ligase-like ATP-grasp enzyme
MTPLSLYPEGAQNIGYTFSQLVETLVNIAYQRGQL